MDISQKHVHFLYKTNIVSFYLKIEHNIIVINQVREEGLVIIDKHHLNHLHLD